MERVQERGEGGVGNITRTISGQRWSRSEQTPACRYPTCRSRGYWEQGGSGEQSLK